MTPYIQKTYGKYVNDDTRALARKYPVSRAYRDHFERETNNNTLANQRARVWMDHARAMFDSRHFNAKLFKQDRAGISSADKCGILRAAVEQTKTWGEAK